MTTDLLIIEAMHRDPWRDDLAFMPVDEPQFFESPKPSVLLVGGGDLAFEGLKAVLLANGLSIDRIERHVRDLRLSASSHRPLLVVDVVDVAAVVDDIQTFRKDTPQACIVLLLDDFATAIADLPADLGVNALLDRHIACDALIKSIAMAMAGYGVVSPSALPDRGRATAVAPPPPLRSPGLSDREIEILGCIAEGQSNKVIARRFSISEATVKIHVRGILRKIDVRNRTQAAIWALQQGDRPNDGRRPT